MIPPSVIWSFYCGAAILILCVLYTFLRVKEMQRSADLCFGHSFEQLHRLKKLYVQKISSFFANVVITTYF